MPGLFRVGGRRLALNGVSLDLCRKAGRAGARRFAPVSGVAAVALILAGFAAAGNAPKGTSSVAKVVAYFSKHSSAQTTSGVLLSLGALLFLVFSASFAARVRSVPGGAALCLLGAGVLAVGLTTYAGLSIAMADVVAHVPGSALQVLNVLADDAVFVFLITIGTSAFLLGAAAAVFGTALLPRWLAWWAVAFAIVGAIPSHVLGGTLDHIGLLAFAGLGIWALVVGVMLTVRAQTAE